MGISDAFEWIWDKISEGWEEIIDLFSGLFSNLNEFSVPGLIAGGAMVFFIFCVRKILLNPFTKYMGPGQAIFTYILCYAGVFAVGYLMAKRAFEQ